MKRVSKVLILVGLMGATVLAGSAFADPLPGLEGRVRAAKQVLSEIMVSPDQSVPEELLAKCRAVAIYPNVLKGGFIFGARFGKGVVIAKDPSTHRWGPVAFSTIGGGSWGFQIGGQMTDLIFVVMNDEGVNGLLSSKFTLGADAAVAAGPVGRNSEVATDLSLKAGIMSYSRSRGLFAGIALDGTVVTQDNHSNAVYYGKNVTSRDILIDHAVTIRPSSKELSDALDEYSTHWSKRIGKK